VEIKGGDGRKKVDELHNGIETVYCIPVQPINQQLWRHRAKYVRGGADYA
jgi:hypothetical protein